MDIFGTMHVEDDPVPLDVLRQWVLAIALIADRLPESGRHLRADLALLAADIESWTQTAGPEDTTVPAGNAS